MARLDLVKCINSKGRIKYIVEFLALNEFWMNSKELRLFEVEKPPVFVKEIEPIIEEKPIVKPKKKK